MSVRVLRPGLLTTVQDQGRHGFQRVGLCPGGAMDPVALALANALVGNPVGEAALEMTRYTLGRLGVSAAEVQAVVQGLRRRSS